MNGLVILGVFSHIVHKVHLGIERGVNVLQGKDIFPLSKTNRGTVKGGISLF
jgi:hypothetical protein